MKHSAAADETTETDLDTPIPYSIASRDNRPVQDITQQLKEARALLSLATNPEYHLRGDLRTMYAREALNILDRIILE